METRCVHCELGNELLNITETTSESCLGCAMVRRLVASLSPRTPELDPRPVHVWMVMDKGSLRQGSSQVLLFSLVSITRTKLHTQFHLIGALTKKQKSQALELPKSNALSEIGEHLTDRLTFSVLADSWHAVSTSHKSCTYTEQHRHKKKKI